MHSVTSLDGWSWSSNLQYLAFPWIEFHVPIGFPLLEDIKLFLELLAICELSDGNICCRIIDKQPHRWLYLFRKVIYVDQEENRPEDRSLRDTWCNCTSSDWFPSRTTVCDLPLRKALIQDSLTSDSISMQFMDELFMAYFIKSCAEVYQY